MITGIFAGVQTPCCMDGTEQAGSCVCGDEERALRAYCDTPRSLPPMTEEQREWCLDEIGQIEGYDRDEHVQDSDPTLAWTVLHAWVDLLDSPVDDIFDAFEAKQKKGKGKK